jgi:hypothetical protein
LMTGANFLFLRFWCSLVELWQSPPMAEKPCQKERHEIAFDSFFPPSQEGVCPRSASILLTRGDRTVRFLLRVAFDPEWFSHPPWLFVSNPKPVPPELASRGLTQAEWNQWMGKLHALRKKLPIFSHPRQLLFSIGTLLTLGTLSCMLPAPGKRAFLRGLLDWQRQFNAECLHKHDITVKTQSYSYKSSYAGPYKVSVISWLVFALGAEEGKLLEAEPYLFGRRTRNSGCLGIGARSERGQPVHLCAADSIGPCGLESSQIA